MKKKNIGWKIVGGVIFIPGLLLLASWIFMLIWNAVMTKVFGLPIISLWQTLGLIALAKILFSNFRGRNKCRCKCKGKGGKKWEKHMEEHFKEKFEKCCAEHSENKEGSSETAEIEQSEKA